MGPWGAKKILEGKRAFITGGSRGLGRALCCAMAAQGAGILFNYSRDDEGAELTLKALAELGVKAEAIKASVLDEKALQKAVVDFEARVGPVDILVNNAGITQPLPLALMDEADWDHVMDINVKGAFLACRAVLRGMIRRRSGAVLNIGSLAGERTIESPVHYAASKAALRGLTQALSKEVAPYGIRVNCLAPGLLEDGVGLNLPEHRLKEYIRHTALGRVGTLEEVARFATFLVSQENSYMSAATVQMSGGL